MSKSVGRRSRRGPSPVAVLFTLLVAGAAPTAGARGDAKPALLEPVGHWTVREFGDAPTPPMGWSSWNAFETDIDEAKVLGSARAIVDQGLRELGYRYVNIDDGWWRRRRQPDGRMIIRTNLFPSARVDGPDETSFRPFTDRIHAMGLKAGIYTDIGRNACSQVNPVDNPNLPEGSVAEREVGLLDHMPQDISTYFGEWGFDYVKVDACGLDSYEPAQNPFVRDGTYRATKNLIDGENLPRSDIGAVTRLYAAVRDAIVAVRPRQDFVFSICNWGTANVRAWGRDVGNLWRTSADIAPTWGRMLHTYDSTVRRELHAGPGHWNDPDMLFIGHGDFDVAHLTEARSHFSLWAIESAPLIIGYDLRDAPRALLDIWGNREVVAIDQDAAGNQGVLAYDGDDLQIIVKQLSAPDDKAVALFNRGASTLKATLSAGHLKMDPSRPIALRDVWTHADVGSLIGERDFELAPRQTILLKARGTPALPGGTWLSDMPARLHVAADGVVVLQGDPRTFNAMDTWRNSAGRESQKVYAGWGAPRADSTPYGRAIGIGRARYPVGIGALANSRIEVKADAAFVRFRADVGVDDSSPDPRGRVRFEVYGDGKLLAATPPQRAGQAAAHLSLAVRGVATLELVARQVGAGAPAIVAWGNAALLRSD
ncbi:MAG: NPCBM/NEW2 domain-containing protein [Betaproteobacteria bacterium]